MILVSILGVSSESAIGVVVFVSTLTAMVALVLFFIVKSRKRREKLSQGFSSVYRGGRRLSTHILHINSTRRSSAIDPPFQASIPVDQSQEFQSYTSLPTQIYSHLDLEEKQPTEATNLTFPPNSV